MFFNTFPYSLFSVELTDDQKTFRYKRVEQADTNDRGFKAHLNDYATSCLLKKDTIKAKDFIKTAIEVDGENMHTWCNKGVLDIEKGELGSAKEAAFKVLELMADDTAACRLRAKLDFAYWKAEVVRTEEARDECYENMKKYLPEASHMKGMYEYLSYYLVKIVVRQLRSVDKRNKPGGWFMEKLSLLEAQLAVLHDSSDYKIDAWLWLSEFFFTNIPDEFANKLLAGVSRSFDQLEITRESCLKKTIELNKRPSNKSRNLTPRMAKNCLDCAYHCDDEPKACNPELQLHWFQKAVDLSEKWIADNYWLFMCSSTAAQGLLHMWAIKFYEENEQLVKDQHWHLYKKKIGMTE